MGHTAKSSSRIAIATMRLDGGTQSRALIEPSVVDEYANALAAGAVFPPVVVFYDGKAHWLADGFHRVRAATTLGWTEIECDVRQGTVRDAILHAVGANATHGLRRTNADKRRAVETLLRDDEWARWSDSKIARACGVSQPTVATVRREVSSKDLKIPDDRPRLVERRGTVYEQETKRIGRGQAAIAPIEVPDDVGEMIVSEDDDVSPVIRPDRDENREWGSFELSRSVADFIATCRSFRAAVERSFAGVSPGFRDEFSKRVEPALLEVTTSILDRLPVDARRAEQNRSRFSVLDGGKK